MKTFAIATITIAAAASLVHAAPAPEPELERRATTNVLLCKNQDFDTCTTLPVVIGGGCCKFNLYPELEYALIPDLGTDAFQTTFRLITTMLLALLKQAVQTLNASFMCKYWIFPQNHR